MAEMERFELSRAFKAPTAFRVRTLQPLGYISEYKIVRLRAAGNAFRRTSLYRALIMPHFFLFCKRKASPWPQRKNQVLNAHNFSLLVLSNFDKPTQPPSCPMVGSLCIFLFSSPCSALLTPSPYECPLCWFLPVTRSVRSLAGTPGT